MKMIEKTISLLEKPRLRYSAILGLVTVFGVVRTAMESLLLHAPMRGIETWAHLVSFFISFFVIGGIILSYLSNSKYLNTLNAMLGLWWLTLLPPVADRFLFARTVSYTYEPVNKFLYNLKTFFWYASGAGRAIVLELLFLSVMAGVFVYIKTKKPARSAAAVLLIYLLEAVSGTPGLIVPVLDMQLVFQTFGPDYYEKIYFLYYSLLSVVFFLIGVKKDLNCTLKECRKAFRFHSLIAFSLIISIGFVIGRYLKVLDLDRVINTKILFYQIVGTYSKDVIDLGLLLLAWFIGWQAVVMVNDIYDIDIDRISNPDRPLPKNYLSKAEYWDLAILGMVGAMSITIVFPPIVSLLMFISVVVLSFIYSAPPLQLKRKLGGASLLMGAGSGLVALMGFWAGGGHMTMQNVPLGVVTSLSFALGINTKDIKDIEGDSAVGAKTFFVVYGYEKGKKITAWLAFLSSLLPLLIFPGLAETVIFFLFALLIGIIFYKTGRVSYVFPIYFLEFFYIAYLAIF